MENIGLGAGLGALGFWGFIAIVAVAAMWDGVRKREAKHETLRRMMESKEPIDPVLMDKLLSLSGSGNDDLGRDLKVSGLIVIFVAPGLAILGLFLGQQAEGALLPLLGVSVLVGLIGVGLLVAAKAIERDRQKQEGTTVLLPGNQADN